VRITSPECARLFLGEKYAIGQVFMEVGRLPRFELIKVGVGKCSELWREYKLEIEGFECDILEVFPDREMLKLGEEWLDRRPGSSSDSRRELGCILLLLAVMLTAAVVWL
jgi:hypothetical protein